MNAGYEPEPTTQGLVYWYFLTQQFCSLIDILFLANLIMAAESNRNNRIAALFGGEGKRRLIDYVIRERHNANMENISK